VVHRRGAPRSHGADGVVHGAWLPRYQRELARGPPGAALAAVLHGTADRGLLRVVPRAVLGGFLDFAIRRTADRRAASSALSPLDLISTVGYDAGVVREAAGPLDRFASLQCAVLLLGGSRSARNLRASLEGLRAVLRHGETVILPGMGHTAPDNGGHPDRVAAELERFLARHPAG